jgi:hypothetical protein
MQMIQVAGFRQIVPISQFSDRPHLIKTIVNSRVESRYCKQMLTTKTHRLKSLVIARRSYES